MGHPFFRSTVNNNGLIARNQACDRLRASMTAALCEGGRIVTTFSMASSSAYIRETTRTKASPLRLPITSRKALAKTLSVTVSGETGGRFSGGSAGWLDGPGIPTAQPVKSYREVNALIAPLAKTDTLAKSENHSTTSGASVDYLTQGRG